MKKIILFLSFLVSAQYSWAESRCFEFPVKKFSRGMQKVLVKIEVADTKSSVAVMTGTSRKGKGLSSTFACRRGPDQFLCTQKDGVGDFVLDSQKEKAVLKLAYINLRLDEIAREDLAEIDEEFAILDIKNSEEDEADHLPSISIEGGKVLCPHG